MTFTETSSNLPWLTILQLLPFFTGLILIRVRGHAALALAGTAATVELGIAGWL